MKRRQSMKIAVDITMSLALVAVMATALVQEVPHEWLGAALFVLMVVHMVQNHRWLGSILRGRYNLLRTLQVIALVGLVACFVGQVASSVVLSKYAFGFLPALPGAGWARRVHMVCSYWMFVLAFAHVGLHARIPRKMAPVQLWALRIVTAIIACYGIYSFVKLGMLPYLIGQVQFAAADYSAPLALSFARYASIGALVAIVFHFIREALLAFVRQGRGTQE